jgi:SAM-dependent methyltransferase
LIGKLKEELGCEDIVGVDISPNMIAIGRASEQDHPLGIMYHVSDVQHLVKPEKKFDFVTAFYLLNYAKASDELERMVHVIGEQLNDSKKVYFLSITWNVCGAENILNTDRYRKYGYLCEAQTPLVDGAQVKNTHFDSDGSSFSYITYYFSPGIYEQVFRKAGFTHFEWVPIEVACDTDEYNDYIKYPPIIGISAHK